MAPSHKKLTLVEPVRWLGTRMVEATLGNARFFRRNGPHPLAVVADTARGIADEVELLLEDVAPLQTAGSNEVSFLDNRVMLRHWIRHWPVL